MSGQKMSPLLTPDEPIVREKQQVKDQQSCIFVFVACLTIPSSNKEHQPICDNTISYMDI